MLLHTKIHIIPIMVLITIVQIYDIIPLQDIAQRNILEDNINTFLHFTED